MSKIPYSSVNCSYQKKSCLYLENDYYKFIGLFFYGRLLPVSFKRVFHDFGIMSGINCDSNDPIRIFEAATSV